MSHIYVIVSWDLFVYCLFSATKITCVQITCVFDQNPELSKTKETLIQIIKSTKE